MRPLVSVVIPTRDRPEMLRAALASVRAQTFTDYDVVVVINGPNNPQTPLNAEIAGAAGARIVRIERAGIAVALNAGVQAAAGEWIAFLDDDDLWEPNRLAVTLRAAEALKADVMFGNIVKFDDRGEAADPPLRPPPSASVREAMTLRNCGGGCSPTMARRAAILAVGGFDETLKSPDWDLWMRLTWRYPVAWDDAYLVRVRDHRENTSKQLSWATSTLLIQWKSFRTLPRDLRHLRPHILLQMAKVAIKPIERYIRQNWLRPLRERVGWKTAARRTPPA